MPIISPDSSEIAENFPKNKGPHTIVQAEGKNFQLLHRLSLEEVLQVLEAEPGLLVVEAFRYEPDLEKPDRPFVAKLAEGGFSVVRLAKHMNKDGEARYFAQRKIQSQEKISAKHKKPPPDKYDHTDRKNVFDTTQKELAIVAKFAHRLKKNNPVFFSVQENKKKVLQIYQFCELACYKDLTNLPGFCANSGLNNIENSANKYAFLAYVANAMVAQVLDIHSLGVRHRDIKPSNFLMDRNANIILTDFGSVAIQNKNGEWEFACPAADRGYMPPDFLRKAQLDKTGVLNLSDQWALAISILEIYGLYYAKENFKLIRFEENNPTEIEKTKEDYKQMLDRIFAERLFKKIPPHLQSFIKAALSLSSEPRPELSSMVSIPQESTKTMKIVKDAIHDAKVEIAKNNKKDLAKMMGKTLTNSNDSVGSTNDHYSDPDLSASKENGLDDYDTSFSTEDPDTDSLSNDMGSSGKLETSDSDNDPDSSSLSSSADSSTSAKTGGYKFFQPKEHKVESEQENSKKLDNK